MTTDVWEQAFLAALTGAACRPWEKGGMDEEYLINRAIRIADLAETQVVQRRTYKTRTANETASTAATEKR